MAITYPLTLPTATGFRATEYQPQTVVGMQASPWTGEQQVYAHPGQWHMWSVVLPPMTAANAALWMAFFMRCNGPAGTFYLGPSVRKSSLGTVGGAWTVGSGAVANSVTLPLTGGTGEYAEGDWLQVGTGSTCRLHRVIQVNMSGGAMVSVDVFPRLRSAYTNGTAISSTNPLGVFRLAAIPPEAHDEAKMCQGLSFRAMEAL